MINIELTNYGTTLISNDAKSNPNPEHTLYGNMVIRKENGEILVKLVELESVTVPLEIRSYKRAKDKK